MTRGAEALLAEIVRQADDAVANGEVKDLAEALAALAPLAAAHRSAPEAA